MSATGYPFAKFRCGKLVITPNALEQIPREEILTGIGRHQAGDWGDGSNQDWEKNELALKRGTRLFSVYHAKSGIKFWIITEADRSVTTILLPREY